MWDAFDELQEPLVREIQDLCRRQLSKPTMVVQLHSPVMTRTETSELDPRALTFHSKISFAEIQTPGDLSFVQLDGQPRPPWRKDSHWSSKQTIFQHQLSRANHYLCSYRSIGVLMVPIPRPMLFDPYQSLASAFNPDRMPYPC